MTQNSGVFESHDLYVWALTSGKASLSVHLVHDASADATQQLLRIRGMLKTRFGIEHTTLQLKLTPCDDARSQNHWVEPRTGLAQRALKKVG